MNEPATAEATISHLPPRAAMMAAIEILLSDPAALGDDTLESGLYILREKLRAAKQPDPGATKHLRAGGVREHIADAGPVPGSRFA